MSLNVSCLPSAGGEQLYDPCLPCLDVLVAKGSRQIILIVLSLEPHHSHIYLFIHSLTYPPFFTIYFTAFLCSSSIEILLRRGSSETSFSHSRTPYLLAGFSCWESRTAGFTSRRHQLHWVWCRQRYFISFFKISFVYFLQQFTIKGTQR